MQLFNINGTDLTRFIMVPSYKVNEFNIGEEWTDANESDHRDIVRTRVQGSFTLKFHTEDEYWDFMDLVNNNKTSGDYLLVTLFLNNKNKVVSKNIFIDFEAANTLPYFGIKEYSGFDVTIKEV